MVGTSQDKKIQSDCDISVIRSQLCVDDFKLRGENIPPATARAFKKGLLALHTLELMASTIYKFQITYSTI